MNVRPFDNHAIMETYEEKVERDRERERRLHLFQPVWWIR